MNVRSLLVSLFVLCAPALGTAQFSKPVCMLKGTVLSATEGAPVRAHILVEKTDSSAGYVRDCYSNTATGGYTVLLDGGAEYRVKVTSTGFEKVDTTLRVEQLNQTKTIEKQFRLASTNVAMDLTNKRDPLVLWLVGLFAATALGAAALKQWRKRRAA